MEKTELVPKGREYDAETGNFVEVSSEMKRRAMLLHGHIERVGILTSLILKEIADNKLYLALGHPDFKQYVETSLPFGYSAAKQYLKIGRKFAPLLPVDLSQVQSTVPEEAIVEVIESQIGPDSDTTEGKGVRDIMGLGMAKLYEIAKLDDEDVKDLMKKDVITLNDGREISLDEIKRQGAKQTQEMLKQHRDYVKQLESELDRSEKEKEQAIKKMNDVQKESEMGQKMAALYGMRSREFGTYKQRLQIARDAALTLNQALSQIQDMPSEYDSLCDELRDLHKMQDRSLKKLREDNLYVFNS